MEAKVLSILKIIANGMTVMVPLTVKMELEHLSVKPKLIKFELLNDHEVGLRSTWNRRYREYIQN